MAQKRYQGYQYETSPRKYEQEFEPAKKAKKNKVKKQQEKIQENKQVNSKFKQKFKVAMCIAVGFIVLFAISYQNSLITETFNKKENLKAQLGAIEKENEQLKVNIEKSLNLSNVEQMAKDRLGMQKLSNSQKIYINLPKKDYIESSKESYTIEENKNIFQKVLELF